MRAFWRLAIGLAATGWSAAAFAHEELGNQNLMSGLTHPLLGFDHLLAMVAVGMLAARRQLGGPMVSPALFMACLFSGALAGQALGPSALVEAGVLATTVLLSVTVLAQRLGRSASMVLIALAGLLHGYAHGGSLTPGEPTGAFLTGVLLASTMLHAAGVATAWALRLRPPLRTPSASALWTTGRKSSGVHLRLDL